MTPTEALKQARELLVRAEIALRLTNEDEFDELAAAARLVRADLRAFLALPSPVEEGETMDENARLRRGLEIIQKTHRNQDSDCLLCHRPWPCADYNYATEYLEFADESVGRDTSKPEEKRYSLEDLEAAMRTAWKNRSERELVMNFYSVRAALTGEGGHG